MGTLVGRDLHERARAAVGQELDEELRYHLEREIDLKSPTTSDVGCALSPIEIIGMVEEIKDGAQDSANQSTMHVPFVQYADTYFSVIAKTLQSERSLLPVCSLWWALL